MRWAKKRVDKDERGTTPEGSYGKGFMETAGFFYLIGAPTASKAMRE